ncbi:MAG: hypothetical protein EXR77_18550 [Myxococcales bacterium]|nr:hypothetical protein [Myxococcales bacterium]
MVRTVTVFALVACLAAACAAETTPAATTAAADATPETAAGDISSVDAAVDTVADAAADTNPAPALDYGVGVLEIFVDGAAGRKLPATVWYPIPPTTIGAAYSYLGLMASPNGAVLDAAAAKGPFPLVAFSHGNQGIRQQSVFLTEALAKRGYVVIAPDHIHNTFFDYDDKILLAVALWRPVDLKASIDRLLKADAQDPPWLAGLVDPKKIAVSGHSFGGYTALVMAGAVVTVPPAVLPNCATPTAPKVVCDAIAAAGPMPFAFSDPRVSLVIPLAHCSSLWTFGLVLDKMKNLKVPAVIEAATGDDLCVYKTHAVPTYNAWAAPKALITLLGGNHFTYSDICLLPVAAGQFAAYCKDRKPDLPSAHKAIIQWTVAACDWFLKGKSEAKGAFAPGNQGLVDVLSEGIYP